MMNPSSNDWAADMSSPMHQRVDGPCAARSSGSYIKGIGRLGLHPDRCYRFEIADATSMGFFEVDGQGNAVGPPVARVGGTCRCRDWAESKGLRGVLISDRMIR